MAKTKIKTSKETQVITGFKGTLSVLAMATKNNIPPTLNTKMLKQKPVKKGCIFANIRWMYSDITLPELLVMRK